MSLFSNLSALERAMTRAQWGKRPVSRAPAKEAGLVLLVIASIPVALVAGSLTHQIVGWAIFCATWIYVTIRANR